MEGPIYITGTIHHQCNCPIKYHLNADYSTRKTWSLVSPLIPVPPFVPLAQHPQIFYVYRKNNSILLYSSYLLMNLL